MPLERVRIPVRADRASQEVADLAPAVPQDAPDYGKPGAHVQLPGRPRQARRDAELERGDDAVRTNDARELAQCGGRVVHVAQQVREREVVEGRVVERQRLRGRFDELDLVSEPLPRALEHPGALIHSGDRESTAEQLGGDEPGSRGDVEHVTAVTREARDEEAPPERVLAEG